MCVMNYTEGEPPSAHSLKIRAALARNWLAGRDPRARRRCYLGWAATLPPKALTADRSFKHLHRAAPVILPPTLHVEERRRAPTCRPPLELLIFLHLVHSVLASQVNRSVPAAGRLTGASSSLQHKTS